jgi:hypothetical protein
LGWEEEIELVLWGRKVVVTGCAWGGMMVGERVEGREGIGIGDKMGWDGDGRGLAYQLRWNFLIFGFLKGFIRDTC